MKQENTYFRRRGTVSARMAPDGRAVLFDADTNRERFLNESGTALWRFLDDGGCTSGDLADRMCGEFDGVTRAEARNDAEEFLLDLAREGFVETASMPGVPVESMVFPSIDAGPRAVDISIAGRCNLRCTYCFYDPEMKTRPDLPGSEWKRFFAELGSLSVREVCLSGGEVFTRGDLWDLVDAVIANRMRYAFLTNGTLVTEKTIAEFDRGKRLKRLNHVQVSLDGSRAEVHDRSRGAGSFEKAVRGLRLFKEAGLPVTVRLTVNRHNVGDLENTARLILDDIGLPGFSTNDAIPVGAGCENQEAITLSAAEQVRAMDVLADLAERYPGRIQAQAGPLTKKRMYGEMEQARRTGERVSWQTGKLTACGCVYDKIAVHHDGVITPCNMLPALELGRINRDDLSDIWRNAPVLKAMKDRRTVPMTDVPGCGDCTWNGLCNGGCPGYAYEVYKDLNRENPADCYRRFLEETGNAGI